MTDHVGRAERGRKPLLKAREIVRRHRDRAFAVLLDDLLHALGNFSERLIPGDLLELPFAALARALHGLSQALRVVPHPHRLRAAGAAAALGMRGVRHDLHGRLGNGLALLVKREQAAVAAAHHAGGRVRFPAFGLQRLDFLRDGFVGSRPDSRTDRSRACSRADRTGGADEAAAGETGTAGRGGLNVLRHKNLLLRRDCRQINKESRSRPERTDHGGKSSEGSFPGSALRTLNENLRGSWQTSVQSIFFQGRGLNA